MIGTGKSNSHLTCVFIFFGTLQLLLFSPRLNSDGAYYYEFARSIAVQQDLNFDDEREFFTWEWVPVIKDFIPGNWKPSGYLPNIFSFGPSIIWIPLIMTSHIFLSILNFIGIETSMNGYDMPYRYAPMATSFLMGIVILILIDRILKEAQIRPSDRAASLFLILGASNLPAFLFVTPAFSHAFSTMASSAFLLLWIRSRDAGWEKSGFALYGIFAGIMALARWQNLFNLILPAVDAAIALKSAPDNHSFNKRMISWLSFLSGFLAAVTPQLIVTWVLYGTPITDPQGQGGMRWLDPWFRLVLFDGLKGLFTVNPVFLIGIIGFVIGFPLIWRTHYRIAFGFASVFAIHVYINAIRRDWAGVGFGMRRFLDVLPVFALGLAIGFQMTRRRFHGAFRYAIWSAGLVCVGWNLLLMGQYYYSELGAPWTQLPVKQMLARQFDMSFGLFFEIVKSTLIGNAFSSGFIYFLLTALALAMTIAWVRILSKFSLHKYFLPGASLRIVWIFLLIVGILDAFLLATHATTDKILAVILEPGKKFGFLKELNVNPLSGYQGIPGGIEFNSDGSANLLISKPEYHKDRFLDLGWMTFNRQNLPNIEGKFSLFFPSNPPVSEIILISILDSKMSQDTLIANMHLTDSASKSVLKLPIRSGVETSWIGSNDIPADLDLLRHEFPAVQRAEKSQMAFRARIHLESPIRIEKLQIENVNAQTKFILHGLGFLK